MDFEHHRKNMINDHDLMRRLAALFSSPKYRPLPERDLAKTLKLESGQRGILRQVLKHMENQGLALALSGGRWSAPTAASGQVVGIFRVRPNGSCWRQG